MQTENAYTIKLIAKVPEKFYTWVCNIFLFWKKLHIVQENLKKFRPKFHGFIFDIFHFLRVKF